MAATPDLFRRKPRNDAEYRLQCAVMQHLHLRGRSDMWVAAIPNGEHRSKRTAGRLKAMGVRPGAPDLHLIVEGRSYGLELKAHGGRQTETQRIAERDWIAAGGVYRVATGIDEALAALVEWGALPADIGRRERPARLPLEDAA